MRTLGSVVVRDFMATQVVTFTPDMEVMTAINDLVKHNISGAPVLDGNGKLVGVLSEKDCLKVALTAGYEGVPAGLVSEFMTRTPITVEPDMPIMEIAGQFLDSTYKRYPVVKNGKLVGQISRRDVLRAINEIC
jgi:CBS domain-containing protein